MTTPEVHSTPSVALKYRKIILAILVFIFLDIGVLVLNFYISYQIKDDGLSINLAGRQRMLSQRIPKVLYQIQNAQQQNAPLAPLLSELKNSSETFNVTLQAFDSGGQAPGGDLKPVILRAIKSPEARQPLEAGIAQWKDYHDFLLKYLDNQSPETLNDAVRIANERNGMLLNLMNSLTTQLEKEAADRAQLLRTIQTVALVLVLINFIYIIFDVIGELRKKDAEVLRYAEDLEEASQQIRQAKLEGDTIFETVRQGLFLLKPDFTIGQQTSAELARIFDRPQLTDITFQHLIKPYITEKEYSTSVDYLTLLFDPLKREKDLQKFNPLARIEAYIPQPDGGHQLKYLEFTFQRIIYNQKVESVLVVVTDNTNQVLLLQQLKESEKRSKREFDLLFNLMHVDASELKEFMDHCAAEIVQINNLFKEQGDSTQNHQEKIDPIFRRMHNLKSHAASLNLTVFEQLAHSLEDRLAKLRAQRESAAEDFLPILIQLSEFEQQVEQTRELIRKIASISANFQPRLVPKSGAAMETLASSKFFFQTSVENLSRELSQRLGRKAELVWLLADKLTITDEIQNLLRDILLQLIRNTYVHGLENTQERKINRKPPEGRIEIQIIHEPEKEMLYLRYQDDGQGLQVAKILKKAVDLNLVPQGGKIEDEMVCSLIFEGNFSTSEKTSTDAGRGVGLNIIKDQVVDLRGGEIQVDFVAGEYTQFMIGIPL